MSKLEYGCTWCSRGSVLTYFGEACEIDRRKRIDGTRCCKELYRFSKQVMESIINENECVLRTMDFVEQVAYFKKEYGFEPTPACCHVMVTLGLVPRFSTAELALLKKCDDLGTNRSQGLMQSVINSIRMRYAGCLELLQGGDDDLDLRSTSSSGPELKNSSPGRGRNAGKRFRSQDRSPPSDLNTNREKPLNRETLKQLNERGFEVDGGEVCTDSVVDKFLEKDYLDTYVHIDGHTESPSTNTFATHVNEGKLEWNSGFLAMAKKLGGTVLTSTMGIVAPLFEQVQNFVVKMVSDGIVSSVKNEAKKFVTFVPKLVEGLCDVIITCLLAYQGGFACGLISLTGVFARWMGIAKLREMIGIVNLEVVQADEGNVAWLITLGTGLVLARLCGIDFDVRWLLAVAMPLTLAYRASGVVGDAFTFIAGLLPEVVRKWLPEILTKSGKGDRVYGSINRLNELAAIGPKSTVFNEFIATYDSLKIMLKGASGPLAAVITRTLATQASFYALCMRERGSDGTRIPPMWIAFHGEKGIGKSVLTDDLICEISNSGVLEELKDIPLQDLKYGRSQSDSYWSGYNGQPFVVIDDYLAMEKSVNTKIESEIMSMITNQVYMLNMASIDNAAVGIKGTAMISRFLITTSNSFINMQTELTCPGALLRRKMLCWLTVVDKDFLDEVNGTVSMEKMKCYASSRGVNLKVVMALKPHLTFYLKNPFSGNNIVGPVSYQDMLRITIAKAKRYFKDTALMREKRYFFGPNGLGINFKIDAITQGDQGEEETVAKQLAKVNSKEQVDQVMSDPGLMMQVCDGIYPGQNMDGIEEILDELSDSDTKAEDICFNFDEGKYQHIMDNPHDCVCSEDACDHCTSCPDCMNKEVWRNAFFAIRSRCLLAQSNAQGYHYDLKKTFTHDLRCCVEYALERNGELRHYDEYGKSSTAGQIVDLGLTRYFRPDYKTGKWKGACPMCTWIRVAQVAWPDLWLTIVRSAQTRIKQGTATRYMRTKKITDYIESFQDERLKETYLFMFYPAEFSERRSDFYYFSALTEFVLHAFAFGMGVYMIAKAIPVASAAVGMVKDKLNAALDVSANRMKDKLINPVSQALDGLVSEVTGIETASEDAPQGVIYEAGSISAIKAKMQPFVRGQVREQSQGDVSFPRNAAYAMATGMVGHVRMFTDDGDDSCCAKGGVVLLSSNFFMIPRHYVERFIGTNTRLRVQILRPGVPEMIKTEVYSEDFKFSKEQAASKWRYDMVMCRVRKCMAGVRNRAHLFVKTEDLVNVNKNGAYLVGYSPVVAGGEPVLWVNVLPSVELINAHDTRRILEQSGRTYMVDSWTYSGSTDVFLTGNCGAILVFPNSASGAWFGGFHRAMISRDAGYTMYWESQLVTAEMLGRWMSVIYQEIPQGILYDRPPRVAVDNEDLTYIGTMEKMVRLSEKTQFVKSPVHPDFTEEVMPWHPSVKEPAILSSKDPRHTQSVSPLCIALRKYRPLKKDFDEEHLKIIEEWMFQDFVDAGIKLDGVRILSEHEAINGVKGVEFLDGLAMDTSPGLPYIQDRAFGVTGKEYLFAGPPGDRIVADRVLRKRLDERLRISKHGELMDNSLWTDSLKDEKLKTSKIKDSQTRVFNVAPLDHLILAKEYLGYFAKWFQHSQSVLWGGIGINPASMDWTQMFRYLGGNDGFVAHDGDWRWFDGKIPWVIYFVCLKVINRWYRLNDPNWKPEHDLVRLAVVLEAFWANQVAMDVVYMKLFGMPSGWFLTAVINCMANYVLGALFFIHVFGIDYLKWKTIRKKFYGDDNVYAYLPQLADRFNGDAMKEFFGEYGLSYTPADKSENFGPSKQVRECEYLKRTVVHLDDADIDLPLISKPSIDEALNWVCTKSTGGDAWEALRINAVGVCDHLVFYGRDCFNQYRDALLKASFRANRPIVLPSFEDIINRMVERNDFPVELLETEWYRKKSECVENVQGDVAETATTESVVSSGTTITSNTGFSNASAGLGSVANPVMRIAELPVSYESIVGKWQTLTPITWNTSSAEGSVLALLNLPMEAIINSQVQSVFDRNSLVRTDVDVMVRCAGTKFQQGILAVGFMPGVTKDVANARLNLNKTAIANLPNVQYIFAYGEQTQMRCPYTAKTNYIHTNADEPNSIKGTIGVFFVAVFTPLRVATGSSTQVNVIISTKFSNCEFHFPVSEVPQGWDWAPISKSASRIISIGKGVFSLAQTVVDGLDTVSRLDHEVAPIRGIVAKGRNPNLNNVDVGVDADIMSLYSGGSAIAMPDHFCRVEDEMSVDFLCSRPVHLTRLTWNNSAPSGTLLYACPITPTMWLSQTTDRTEITPPTVDYIALMFARWRCDICVEVVVSATAFVSGSLRFSSLLGYFNDIVNIEETTAQSFASMDVSEGKRHFKMRIPYSSISSTKDVLVDAWSTIALGDAREQYAMGTWFLHIENPLVVSGNVSTTVDIEVFYHLENSNFFDLPPVKWSPIIEVPQGDILVNNGDAQNIRVVDNSAPIASLRDVVRRYAFYEYNTAIGTAGRTRVIYRTVDFMSSGPIAAISQMYAGARGSINVSVAYAGSAGYGANRQFFCLYDPVGAKVADYTNTANFANGLKWACTNTNAVNAPVELNLPFTYKYNYVSTGAAVGLNAGSSAPIEDVNVGVLVVGLYNVEGAATTHRLIVHVGGGDDFRGGLFIGPPSCNLLERN